jgi:hypothetical protein
MELRRSESIDKLVSALAKAGLEFEKFSKDQQNFDFQSNFASLATEIYATKEALNRNGIAVLQFPRTVMGKTGRPGVEVTTMLACEDQFLAFELIMPAEKDGRFDCQTIAQGVTFGRRISYESALCIRGADPDDDGNGLRGSVPQGTKAEAGGKRGPQSQAGSAQQMKLAVGSPSCKFAPPDDGNSYAL